MSAGDRTLTVEGHEFVLFAELNDNEPRCHDLGLGRWLEYARPEKIRDLIKGLLRRGLFKRDAVFTVQGKTSGAGGRPAQEYWPTRRQALHIIRHSGTAVADRFMDEVFNVFDLAVAQVTAGRARTLESRVKELEAENRTLALGAVAAASLGAADQDVVLLPLRRLAELQTGLRWPARRRGPPARPLTSARSGLEREVRRAVGWHDVAWRRFPVVRAGELAGALDVIERRLVREGRKASAPQQLRFEGL